MDETILKALWTVNSEDGYEYLVNLKTSEILAKRDKHKNLMCIHPSTWFDRTIELRKDGTEHMADICTECGEEVHGTIFPTTGD